MTHDPRQEIEKLRDHLASHDKPIVFLIGAGASAAVRVGDQALIPAIAALTEECALAVKALGSPYAEAYATLVDALGAREDQARAPNIEDVLSSVRQRIAAMGAADSLGGATRAQLQEVEKAIRTRIAATARPSEESIPHELPHHALARWIARIDRSCPVELFTTNYDTLLERALEDERVAVFDGFVGSRDPFFSSASLLHEDAAPGGRWARLWKIHGSINWAWKDGRDGARRIVRGPENDEGELILPSAYKYDESRKQPYVAMLDRLARTLSRRDDTLLVVIGFSFGDQHINEVIFDALDARERTHVVALQFSEPPEDEDLMTRALRRRNLLVYGPESAVVGGVRGEWRLLEPVDRKTAGLIDIPFDSDAFPDPERPALTGRFRLGDFKWFGRFLDEIAGVH